MRRLHWLVLVLLLTAAVSAGTVPDVKDGYFPTGDGVRLHYLETGSGPYSVFLRAGEDGGGTAGVARFLSESVECAPQLRSGQA